MYEQFARRGDTPSLELGVGSGRIALQLARSGLDVVGVDASRPMLARLEAALDRATAARDPAGRSRYARPRSRRRALRPGVLRGEHVPAHADDRRPARGAPLGRGASDGRRPVRHAAARATCHRLGRRADAVVPSLDEARARQRRPDAALRFHCCRRSRPDRHTTHLFDRVSPDGVVSRKIIEYTLRYTSLSELTLLVEAAGLRVAAVYGDTELSPYDDESDTMILVSEREGT